MSRSPTPIAILVLIAATGCRGGGEVETTTEATPVAYSPPRSGVGEEDAKARVARGALLVCAYPDEAKCELYGIDPAISLAELEARIDSLEEDQEILFYCACPDDASARRRAAEYRQQGFRADFVRGGFHALANGG